MGRKGKKPDTEQEFENKIVETESNGKFPAPDGLPDIAKACWEKIVSSVPQSHFRSCDLPLLERYCMAEYIYALAKDNLIDKEKNKVALIIQDRFGKVFPNPALKIMQEQAVLQSGLSVKLKITPSSRLTHKEAAREEDEGRKDDLDELMYRE